MHTPQPTPEERAEQMRFFNALMTQMNQQNNAKSVMEAQQPVAQKPVITEDELGARINGLPPMPAGVLITKGKSGFTADGVAYVDPEGTIVKVGVDSHTGDVTYLVRTGTSTFDIKVVRAGTKAEPVLIGEAVKSAGSWQVKTVTGKKIAGDVLVPLGKGLLIARDSNCFVYEPGKDTKTTTLPTEFVLADFQNGHVQETRYVLLEKIQKAKTGSPGGLFDAVVNLGSVVGLINKEDFMLFNIDTGKTVALNVSYDGKNITSHSNCTPGKYFNKCERVDFTESLYNQYGLPNHSHYYWRIYWVKTSEGPIAIVTDNTLVKVDLIHLDTATKLNGLFWLAGFNSIKVEEMPGKKYKVIANILGGITDKQIDDVEAYWKAEYQKKDTKKAEQPETQNKTM
jgi:hypothetical protein